MIFAQDDDAIDVTIQVKMVRPLGTLVDLVVLVLTRRHIYTELQKSRYTALLVEKRELIASAEALIKENEIIKRLEEVGAEDAGFRRRFILKEMFAFQVGLGSRRWETKVGKLRQEVENPREKRVK